MTVTSGPKTCVQAGSFQHMQWYKSPAAEWQTWVWRTLSKRCIPEVSTADSREIPGNFHTRTSDSLDNSHLSHLPSLAFIFFVLPLSHVMLCQSENYVGISEISVSRYLTVRGSSCDQNPCRTSATPHRLTTVVMLEKVVYDSKSKTTVNTTGLTHPQWLHCGAHNRMDKWRWRIPRKRFPCLEAYATGCVESTLTATKSRSDCDKPRTLGYLKKDLKINC